MCFGSFGAFFVMERTAAFGCTHSCKKRVVKVIFVLKKCLSLPFLFGEKLHIKCVCVCVYLHTDVCALLHVHDLLLKTH